MMGNETFGRRCGWAAVFTGLAVWLVAVQSQAQTQFYNLSGAFVRAEGQVVELPIVGNTTGTPCTNLVGVTRSNGGNGATTPPFVTAPAPLADRGCVKGKTQPVAVFTGGSKASFELPAQFFQQLQDSTPNSTLVVNPAIISFRTNANYYGPLPEPVQFTGENTRAPLAPWRRFAQLTDPAIQSGRAGLAFSWCPALPATGTIGGTSPGPCTGILDGPGGIVKYNRGSEPGSGFGGIASMILQAEQGPMGTNIPGTLGLIGFGAFGLGGNSLGKVAVAAATGDLGGKGYGAIRVNSAPGFPVYVSYMVSAGGFVTAFTPPTPVFSVPGSVNTDNQFPFTTGSVVVRNILASNAGPRTVTKRIVGADNRTAMGLGNIQLVSGTIRWSANTGTFGPNVNAMNLTFSPVPEPGAMGMLAAGGLLITGLAMRQRFRA